MQNEPIAEAREASKERRWLRFIWLVVPIAAIGLVLPVGYWGRQRAKKIPESVRTAGFKVYYPETLPEGYSLDQGETRVSGGMVFYSVRNKANDSLITLTVQSAPKDFNPKRFFYDRSAQAIGLSTGTAYDLGSEQQTRYMLVTSDQLLIFASSNNKIADLQMRNLLSGLRPVN